MRLALVTMMRDAAPYLPAFRRMVDAFTVQPHRIVLGENDSADTTRACLEAWATGDPRVDAFSFRTGVPTMDRIRTPARSAYMADVWNRCVERALAHDDWDVALVTSTQKWSAPGLPARLLRQLDAGAGVDIVAPRIHFADGPRTVFYDTWCFRHADGRPFVASETTGAGLERVAAVGGVYVVPRMVYAAGCRLAATDGRDCESVAFSAQARAAGFGVYVDHDAPPAWACWTPDALERCAA